MLPGLIAAPFSILSAALPNTNITDIITSAGSFSFEPTTLLFVNYPQSSGEKSFESLVVAGDNGNTTLNQTLSVGNSTTVGDSGDPEGCGEEGNEGGKNLNNDSHAKAFSDDFLATLSSSSALQVSVNMTVDLNSITQPPIFAVNGTYDESDLFLVGIFHFFGSSSDSCRVHFLGGNYSAQGIFGGTVSVLTNSTPALIEYTAPQNVSESDETGKLVYLLFSQSSDFSSSSLFDSSTGQNQTLSISEFVDETGIGSPIGGSMVWLSANDSNTSDSSSSLTLEGSIPAEYYTSLPSSSDASSPVFTDSSSSLSTLPTGSGADGFGSPSDSSTTSNPSVPVESSTGAPDGATGTDNSSSPTYFPGRVSTNPLSSSDSESMPSTTDTGFPSESSGNSSLGTGSSPAPSEDGSADSSVPTSSSDVGTSFLTSGAGGLTSSPVPTSSTGTSASSPDTDDDNLPWCDELEDDDVGSGTNSTSSISTTTSIPTRRLLRFERRHYPDIMGF
ncbi:hypothetical protein ACEPAI_9262 [Sanghuangporus weigelae]